MAEPGLTIADIRTLLPKEKKAMERNELWGHWVFRPVSYYPTWLFLKLGISANGATIMSFILGLIGCALLAFSNYIGIIIGAVLINLWALLDFVDGNIARYFGSGTKCGAFIDNANGLIVSSLFFLSAGIGAFHHGDLFFFWLSQSVLRTDFNNAIFIMLGGWTSLSYIYPRFIADEFAKVFSREQGGLFDEFRGKTFSSILYKKIHRNLNITTGLVMPALLLAAIFNCLGSLVLIWALITTSATLVILVKLIREAGSQNVSERK